MDSKKFKLVLAMTVLTLPLAFTACGKDIDEVPVEDTQASVESTINTEVNETIEEDLADVGIKVTPTPEATPTPTPEVNKVEIDTSMADTYYIIIQDQNIYKEPDVNSDVITTCIVDTMITVSGIHEESGMFEVVDANGDIIGYVDSGFCDTVKGGYQSVEEDTTTSTETPTEDTSDEKTEVEQNADEFMGSLTEEEQQELLDQIESSRNEGIPNSFWEQHGQGGSSGGSTYDPSLDGQLSIGTGDYSDLNPNVNMN